MGKDKLRRFAEITAFANVIELEDGKRLNGQWAEQHFKNKNPVVLELGCGKGEYTVNLGRLFSEINFIGIDYKGEFGGVPKPHLMTVYKMLRFCESR